MDCCMLGFPVLHHLLEFAQTHAHLLCPPKVHLFCSTPQTPPFPLYLGTVILGRHCLGVHRTDVLLVFCVSGLGSTDTKFGKHLASLPPLTIFLSTKIALKKLPHSSPCLPSLRFFKKEKREREWRHLLLAESSQCCSRIYIIVPILQMRIFNLREAVAQPSSYTYLVVELPF